MRTITYAFNTDGEVISRMGDQIAHPILDYKKIGEGGDFTQPFEYFLDTTSVLHFSGLYSEFIWTKRIPVELKNFHRIFWGLPPLPVNPEADERALSFIAKTIAQGRLRAERESIAGT